MSPNPLRNLPSVHELLESPPLRTLVERISQSAVVSTVRTVLEEVRHEVQTAAADRTLPSVSDLAERIARRVAENQSCALRPVINATGTLLHPCLGRALLAEEAIAEMAAVARDYADLGMEPAGGQTVAAAGGRREPTRRTHRRRGRIGGEQQRRRHAVGSGGTGGGP